MRKLSFLILFFLSITHTFAQMTLSTAPVAGSIAHCTNYTLVPSTVTTFGPHTKDPGTNAYQGSSTAGGMNATHTIMRINNYWYLSTYILSLNVNVNHRLDFKNPSFDSNINPPCAAYWSNINNPASKQIIKLSLNCIAPQSQNPTPPIEKARSLNAAPKSKTFANLSAAGQIDYFGRQLTVGSTDANGVNTYVPSPNDPVQDEPTPFIHRIGNYWHVSRAVTVAGQVKYNLLYRTLNTHATNDPPCGKLWIGTQYNSPLSNNLLSINPAITFRTGNINLAISGTCGASSNP